MEDLQLKYLGLIYGAKLADDAKATYWSTHGDPKNKTVAQHDLRDHMPSFQKPFLCLLVHLTRAHLPPPLVHQLLTDEIITITDQVRLLVLAHGSNSWPRKVDCISHTHLQALFKMR